MVIRHAPRPIQFLTKFARMKRILLPLLACLPGALLVAQTYHGPRVGLGLATQSVGGLFQNTSDLLVGPEFGWGLDILLHPQFSIMPELLYMTKGAVVRNPAQDTHSRTTFRYLELPVMVKVGTDTKAGGMLFTLGPSLGYYLSGNSKSWLGDDLVTDVDYELGDADRFEFSGAVGIGFDQKKWTFEMRAQTGLTPFSPVTEVHNVVYSFLFAWRFEVKQKENGGDQEE